MVIKSFFSLCLVIPLSTYSQSVEEIVKNYNQAIDPTGKLDHITHLQVDSYLIIFSPSRMINQYDTSTCYYSIHGDNYFKKWNNGSIVDMNQMANVSKWERDNIIKNQLNFLICDEDESFELVESTDSTYMVKIYSWDREVFYEIERNTYDLKRMILKYQGTEMTTWLYDYSLFNGIKVATRLIFQNEIVGAEMVKFGYRFKVAGKNEID